MRITKEKEKKTIPNALESWGKKNILNCHGKKKVKMQRILTFFVVI